MFENIFCKTSLSFCRMAPAQWISTSSVKWWWPSPSLGMIKKTPEDVRTFFHLWIKVKVVVCLFLCGCGQYTAIYILAPRIWAFPVEIIGLLRHLLQADSCTFYLWASYWLARPLHLHLCPSLFFCNRCILQSVRHHLLWLLIKGLDMWDSQKGVLLNVFL